MDFNDIVGHEKVISNIQRSIDNGRISHSYLFEGPESIGKKKIAHVFAKTLLCHKKGISPCNSCASCIKVESGNHPDLMFVEPEKGSIKKDQIEEVIKSTYTLPIEGDKKIYIIDDSHNMTIQAQNAFLKTLEEPPAHLNFILISTNSKSLLPTIVSRCQVIKFFPVEEKKIIDFLMNKYGKSLEKSSFIASFSKGSIGKAIKLANSDDFLNIREETINIICEAMEGDKLRTLNRASFFKENEEDIDEILDIILYWFRDILIYKETKNDRFIINKDKIQLLKNYSSLSISKINDIIECVKDTKENLRGKVNFNLSIEIMLLKFQEV